MCLLLWLSPVSADNGAPGPAQIGDVAANLPYEISRQSSFLLDPTLALTVEEIVAQPHTFKPVRTPEPAFGYRSDAIWLQMRVRTGSDTSTDWRLTLAQAFLFEADVYHLVEGGRSTKVLSQNAASAFNERPLPYRHVAAPVTLAPGTTHTFLVRYRSSGYTGLRVYLTTAGHFAAQAATESAKSFLFQGVLALLVIAGLGAFVAVRSATALHYALYLASCALFVLNRDGFGFQYVWPEQPQFNAYASLVFGTAMIVFGSAYARAFLQTHVHHRVFDKVLFANAVLGPLAAVGLATLATLSAAKQSMVLLASASALLFLLAGLNAARTRGREVRFFVFAWLGVALSALVVSGRHLFGLKLSGQFALDSMRLVIVYDGLMMGLAVVDRFLQMRASSRRALEENLANAERNLALRERLDRLEARAELASTLAEQRGRALADASHDLRQPIMALRMNVKQLTSRTNPGKTPAASSADEAANDAALAENIAQAFDYLEALVEHNLDTEPASATGADSDPGQSRCEVTEVFKYTLDMFADDAAAKSLRLNARSPAKAAVACDAMVLMRILSNLVGNAIKYSTHGGVLLACRPCGDALRMIVYDTGQGFAEGEFEQLTARSMRRLEEGDPDGHGLGLDITHGLVSELGATLECRSLPGRGSAVSFVLPRAAD